MIVYAKGVAGRGVRDKFTRADTVTEVADLTWQSRALDIGLPMPVNPGKAGVS